MKTIIHVSDWAMPPGRVFEVLATLTGLAAWWTTKVAGDAGLAGVIDVTVDGDFNPAMQVTDFACPSMPGWRCVAGAGQWRQDTFGFWLEARGARTRLRFRQDGELSDDDYGAYARATRPDGSN